MQKHFSLLIALLFLFVQMASIQHMAEHGFAGHKHHGHVCDIYLNGETAKTTGTSGFDLTVTGAVLIDLTSPSVYFVALRQEHHRSGDSRAPPTTLLS